LVAVWEAVMVSMGTVRWVLDVGGAAAIGKGSAQEALCQACHHTGGEETHQWGSMRPGAQHFSAVASAPMIAAILA